MCYNLICNKCGDEGEIGRCPYASEIYDEHYACNCCEECRKQCGDDI